MANLIHNAGFEVWQREVGTAVDNKANPYVVKTEGIGMCSGDIWFVQPVNKSQIKLGNITFQTDKKFNRVQKFMCKIFFGFVITDL